MKTLRFFLFLAIAFFSFANAAAQNTMRIHRTDGTIQEISISEIEKIDWYEKLEPSATFENITLNGITYKLGTSGAVDLGLSVKWATMNVGASAPGDYGDYYAWGETATKSIYDWSTYFDSVNGSSSNFTKYATDKKTVLDPEDDVAHVKWGGSWRMPTDAELTDLRTKCGWVWAQYGGHNGYVVIGSTGNAIFLPAAGFRHVSGLNRVGSWGVYWSSSLDSGYLNYAYYVLFGSGGVNRNGHYRYYGRSVRAVAAAQNTMRIHRTDGTIQEISISEIEKIDWYEKSEPSATFENITLNGITYKLGTSGAVDLGLSVKWATMNVGASAPGDYGDYYAWGETETKSIYNWSTYLDSPYRDGYSFTKYATDKKTVLDPEDDVAHVKWGGSWRMPTDAELTDLRTKCGWVWAQYGGHNGYVVIGSTGNAIFLPAAGYRYDSGLSSVGSWGRYWSSSLLSGNSSGAYLVNFYSGNVRGNVYSRYDGHSVRAVCQ